MKLELSNMKKILLLGLLISSIYISSCKKEECNQSDNIISRYDSINQIYIDAFVLDTSKKIILKKYKSDSILVFTFKNKLKDYKLNYSNQYYDRCSTFIYYYEEINYSYTNQNNETLTISQNPWNLFIIYRNYSLPFWNGDLKNNNYKYDSISFSNNIFYDVFRSNEVSQTPTYAAYYNIKYGIIRLRFSFYDIWDIKL
jgi:hypothetical protein